LLHNLGTPDLDLRQMLFNVQDEVDRLTSGKQRPELSISLVGQYKLKPATGAPANKEVVAAPQVAALPPNPPQAPVTAPPPVATSDARRFDGLWLATETCPRAADGALGFSWQFIAEVKGGVFRGQHGEVGKPDSQTFDGKIQADGAALISMTGLSGASAYLPGGAPPGSPIRAIVIATFQDSAGSGTQRVPERTCNFVFAKQGAPSAQPSVATLSDVPKSTTSTTVFAPPRPTSSDVGRAAL
jgi:hypothetical protein